MSSRVHVKICGITNIDDALAAVEAGANALGFVFYRKSPRYIAPSDAFHIIQNLPPFVGAVGLFVNERPDKVMDVMRRVPLTCLQFHGDESPEYCSIFSGDFWNKRLMNSLRHGALTSHSFHSYISDFDLDARAFLSERSGIKDSWFKKGWGMPWIKALAVREGLDINHEIKRFSAVGARGILLDAWHPELKGGTGRAFDWRLFPTQEEFHRHSGSSRIQLILAGGLNPENVREAISKTEASAVDVSGGVELFDCEKGQPIKGRKDFGKMEKFIMAVDSVRFGAFVHE